MLVVVVAIGKERNKLRSLAGKLSGSHTGKGFECRLLDSNLILKAMGVTCNLLNRSLTYPVFLFRCQPRGRWLEEPDSGSRKVGLEVLFIIRAELMI